MISKDRQYRNFEIRANTEAEGMIIEGYATPFNQETVMYEFDGIEYKEKIDNKAFDTAQMKDVVLNYNHEGKVLARTKNSTLELETDDYGLKVKADLSGTEEGRKTYEEIKGGYLDKMSFAFTVDKEEYNTKTRTRTISAIKRLYDVAIVDIPAYDTTSVYARNYYEEKAKDDIFFTRKNEIINKRNQLKDKISL